MSKLLHVTLPQNVVFQSIARATHV